MKRFILLVLAILFLSPVLVPAQDDDVNVLSYYAVGNSLDGQILINTVNVLRFYPVFAARNITDTVRVTIYYGPNTFTRLAAKMEDGRYWQVLLPPFHLGEAIQRLEVETHVKIDPIYRQILDDVNARFAILKNTREQFIASTGKVKSGVSLLDASLNNLNTEVNARLKDLQSINAGLAKPGSPLCTDCEKLYHDIASVLIPKIDALTPCSDPNYLTEIQLVQNDIGEIVKKTTSVGQAFIDALNSLQASSTGIASTIGAISTLPSLTSSIEPLQKALDTLVGGRDRFIFALRDTLVGQLTGKVVDTNYLGIGIRTSDVMIDENFEGAKILYRNYKSGLRQLPALDPAERLGVFRARYVPFAVIGGKLRGPFGNHSSSTHPPVGIFEVGLGFGDVAVPGDDFVKPELSIRRLGVSFVITEKLFNADAQILALAVTYDFNSYGSIGAGANFAPLKDNKDPESYFSFGINKLAFEALLGQIQNLFR